MSCQLLHRIDPDQNMARFYRVEMRRDLFGAVTVERSWGRIGTRGQARMTSFPAPAPAATAAAALLRAKMGRGYVALA